jgi:elongation factor Ts
MVELYSHGNGRVGVMVESTADGLRGPLGTIPNPGARDRAADRSQQPEVHPPGDIPPPRLSTRPKPAWQAGGGKSDAVIDKIVEGYLDKYKDEVCLLRQAYIRDDTTTVELIMQNVAAIGENVVVRRFQRWELGESTPVS